MPQLIAKMEALINSKDFATNHRSNIQLLNCMRVLTRLMPYVFENPDSGEWENEFFWTPQQIEIPPSVTTNLEGQVQTAFGEQVSTTITMRSSLTQCEIDSSHSQWIRKYSSNTKRLNPEEKSS